MCAAALRRGNRASRAGSGAAAQVIWPVVQPDREQRRRLTANRVLAPAIFALLVVATLAAFAAAQRLKREPLILDKVTIHPLVNGQTAITPNGDGHADLARIRFRLTRSDHGVVQIINRNDDAVRALTVKVLSRRNRVLERLPPGARLPSYKVLAVRWNGRTGGGRPAPTGPYRLRVRLLGEDRTLVPGGRIRVHRLQQVSNSGPGG
jgi:hypothetical protein